MSFSFAVPAATRIYTLSLHDALPISRARCRHRRLDRPVHGEWAYPDAAPVVLDRKSTRLNSSHLGTSYAVFCLKKKNRFTDSALTSATYTITSGGGTGARATSRYASS